MSSGDALFSVKGKVALVTGASSGLGAHFATLLASQGANVIVAARRADKLNSVVDSINELKKTNPDAGTAHSVVLDVSAGESAVNSAVDEAWSKFDGINILVNNAGVFRGGVPALDETSDDWDVQFGINVKGLWLVARAFGRKISHVEDPKSLEASIINISSCVGNPGGVAPGVVTYAATKATVQHITRSLALELGKYGIRVNSISPGVFPSEMSEKILDFASAWHQENVPAGRIGDTSHDLDGPLLLLASNAGSYITGTNLTVDGGLSILSKSFFG